MDKYPKENFGDTLRFGGQPEGCERVTACLNR